MLWWGCSGGGAGMCSALAGVLWSGGAEGALVGWSGEALAGAS